MINSGDLGQVDCLFMFNYQKRSWRKVDPVEDTFYRCLKSPIELEIEGLGVR
jgi:hypothetical protein